MTRGTTKSQKNVGRFTTDEALARNRVLTTDYADGTDMMGAAERLSFSTRVFSVRGDFSRLWDAPGRTIADAFFKKMNSPYNSRNPSDRADKTPQPLARRRGFFLPSSSGRRASHKEEPMTDTITLSDEAVGLLRHLFATEDQSVTPDNLEAYRELVRAGIMIPISGMVGGPETHFIFSESGWHHAESIVRPVASP